MCTEGPPVTIVGYVLQIIALLQANEKFNMQPMQNIYEDEETHSHQRSLKTGVNVLELYACRAKYRIVLIEPQPFISYK